MPGDAAAKYGDAVRAGIAADEAAVEAAVAAAAQQGGSGGRMVEVAGLERQGDMEAAFGETVERLGRLKGGPASGS